jgi:hypothetical protein
MYMELYVDVFLTSEIVGDEWSDSRSCRFTPWDWVPKTHWLGVWVHQRNYVEDMEKWNLLILPGHKPWSLSCQGSSHSLYRLPYHGSSASFQICPAPIYLRNAIEGLPFLTKDFPWTVLSVSSTKTRICAFDALLLRTAENMCLEWSAMALCSSGTSSNPVHTQMDMQVETERQTWPILYIFPLCTSCKKGITKSLPV